MTARVRYTEADCVSCGSPVIVEHDEDGSDLPLCEDCDLCLECNEPCPSQDLANGICPDCRENFLPGLFDEEVAA